MVWVIVFVGIALAGLVMCICYAVWLGHKAADVWSEVDMLAARATEFADLVGQIQVPERTYRPDWQNGHMISEEIDDASAT
jgi:putative Ca2+/H+ antiporter (TMEM165/GDT1 family)